MIELGAWKASDVKIGMIAWLLIILTGMFIFFKILETNGTEPLLFIFSFELLFGIGVAALADVQTIWNSNLNMQNEVKAVTIGIMGAAVIIITQLVVGIIATSSVATELVILAAVPEELFFRLVIYGTFRRLAPELSWIFAAIPSSFIFASYHYFVNGLAFWPTVVLFLGAVVLSYLFEMTRNIAAPMIAHLINNSMTQIGSISETIAMNWYIVIIPIILIIIFICCSGGRKR